MGIEFTDTYTYTYTTYIYIYTGYYPKHFFGCSPQFRMYVARFRHQPSLRLDAKEDILQPTALTATCGASLPLKLRAEPRMECHCDVEDGSR